MCLDWLRKGVKLLFSSTMSSDLIFGFIFCGGLALLFIFSPIIILKNILYLRKVMQLVGEKRPLLRRHRIRVDFPQHREINYLSDPIKAQCYAIGLKNAFRLNIKSGISVELGIIVKAKSIFSSNQIQDYSAVSQPFEEKYKIECSNEKFPKVYLDLKKIECLDVLSSHGLLSVYCKFNLLVAVFDNSALELSEPEFERVVIEPLKRLADSENSPDQKPFIEISFFDIIKGKYPRKL